MHAVDFYTSVCRHVMTADPNNVESWSELRRLLPCLRQSLGCYVCFSVLREPMGPNHNVCRHFVCKQCVGGKMKLKPSCSWCKDHWLFVPNQMLKILVTCFKKLCTYIYCSPLGEAIVNSCVNGETNNVLSILREGMEFSDRYTSSTIEATVTEISSLPSAIIDNVPLTSADQSTSRTVQPSTSYDISNESKPDRLDGEEIVHASSFRISKKLHKKKAIKKSVKFMKKAAQVKAKEQLKLSQRQSSQKSKVSKVKRKFKGSRYREDAPGDLEKMDVSQPVTQKVKTELHPPELKPLSSCNCGKSGNFNQLTCIGQRCPCYSMKLPCMGSCKCRGCRNPKKGPDYHSNNTCSSAVLRSGTRTTTESLCVNL